MSDSRVPSSSPSVDAMVTAAGRDRDALDRRALFCHSLEAALKQHVNGRSSDVLFEQRLGETFVRAREILKQLDCPRERVFGVLWALLADQCRSEQRQQVGVARKSVKRVPADILSHRRIAGFHEGHRAIEGGFRRFKFVVLHCSRYSLKKAAASYQREPRAMQASGQGVFDQAPSALRNTHQRPHKPQAAISGSTIQ